MSRRIVLTGAATLVGAEVLRELLLRSDVEAIQLLMPMDQASRSRDLERLGAYLGPMPGFVTTVASDLRLPRFGMSLNAWKEFATSFDLGIHCAQRDVKDQNLELARQANRLPVENWIDLLESNPELRLHHLSTAFVGGTRRGLFTEFDLECGQGFHNAWERSMFEAEARLRDSRISGRVTVYRPSHTLGRGATGEALHFGGAYPLLGTMASASVLPGDARARIDVVPADYVAAALVALVDAAATGTFHLACGWNTSLPVPQAAAIAAKCKGRWRGARLLPRAIAWPLGVAGAPSANGGGSRRLAFTTARDLLNQGPVFDTYLADLALEPLGIGCPAPETWLEKTLRAAEAGAWTAPPKTDLEQPAAEAALPSVVAEAASIRSNPIFREKHFHRVGDVNVAYRDIGKGEPIVFLHGFAGAHAWDGVVERVAARRRALVVETLGLGDTEGPSSAEFGLPAQAAMVRGLLSALEIPAAHIVGNDTGGVIAQFFAVRWPHCVKSLVLSDCDAHGTWPPTHVASAAAVMGIPGGTLALASLMKIRAVARSRFGFGRMVHDKRLLTPDRLARYSETVAGNRERRIRLKRFFRSFDRGELATMNQLLGQLRVPALIIWGAENAYWSTSWARTLYDAIPGARRLELIPFAGISCHEERPDLFAQLLTDFLDQVESEANAG
ncbi:MAG TPA: alpha/beta fold hydrolase [Terriglobia bacterium]|nr:alpha/beta fold hydrolase [Terriglobia bacterium]